MDARLEPPRDIQDAARAWIAPLKTSLGADFIAAYLTGSVLAKDFDVRITSGLFISASDWIGSDARNRSA